MLDTIFKRLRGKKILIAGFGREGKSTLAFLNKYLPHATIGIADKNESVLPQELQCRANKAFVRFCLGTVHYQ